MGLSQENQGLCNIPHKLICITKQRSQHLCWKLITQQKKNAIELEFAKKLSGDKALLEWNAINQEALIHYGLLAKDQHLTINELELKHFKSDIEFNFFKVWIRKAKLLKKLNT
jgi:hypothetical protein